MIEFKQSNKYSIKFEYNENDVQKLIEELDNAIANNVGIHGVKVITEGVNKTLKFKKDNEENRIVSTVNEISITMDEDELEYAKKRFIDSMIDKCFFPAELCECTYKKYGITIYVYLKKDVTVQDQNKS